MKVNRLKKNNLDKAKFVRSSILIIIGIIFYATGINCFAAPHKIAPGGASGIAILVNYVTGFPIGFFAFLFNVPLVIFIIYKKLFDIKFLIKSVASISLLSIATDYVVVHFPLYHGNPILAAMFGGALMGIGLALVHMGDANTGGISLLGLIIQKMKPRFQVGALISFLNIAVVLISGIVYKNIDSLLYAMLTVYVSGLFMDKILEQAYSNGLIIVISEKIDEIRSVFVNSKKGVTILNGVGGYSNQDSKIVLCVATKSDCAHMEKLIKEIDEQALIVITDASRVIGKGFKHIV